MAKTNDKTETQGGSKILEPPHNVHLARKVNEVKCRIDLYKIPPQCINFEPTKTHIYLDTFKFTKKYRLNIPYPEGVQVDTNVEAEFDSGVLRCSFPILQDPNRPADLDEIVAAREAIKDMRKKGIPVPIDLMDAAKLAKTKEKQPDDEKEELTPSKDKKKTKEKKVKKPLSNKEKRQLEKAKRALEDEDEVDGPKKKKAKKENNNKKDKNTKEAEAPKNKSFMENTSAALEVADQVNDQQEQAIQEKMDREYAKLTVDHRKKIERHEKKLQVRALRKQEAEKEDQPKKEKTKKKKTKVSFA